MDADIPKESKGFLADEMRGLQGKKGRAAQCPS
jgi:hypothetical protein